MRKPRSAAWRLVAVALCLIVSGVVPPAPALAQAGVAGSSYTSPTYGWSIDWSPGVWTVDDASSSGGRDEIVLVSSASFLYLFTYEGFGGDALDCLDASAERLASQDDYRDVRLYEASESNDRNFASSYYTFETGNAYDGIRYLIAYLYCIHLGDGVVLDATYFTFQGAFEYEADHFVALWDTFEAPPPQEDRDEPEDDRDEPDDDREEPEDDPEPPPSGDGLDGDTYTHPSDGWSIAWDDSDWEVQAADDDGIGLSAPVAAVAFESERRFDDDAEECVEEIPDDWDADFGPVPSSLDAPRLPDAGPNELFVLLTPDAPLVIYLECRPLASEESLLTILMVTGYDDYDRAVSRLEDLLDSLEVPGSRGPAKPLPPPFEP